MNFNKMTLNLVHELDLCSTKNDEFIKKENKDEFNKFNKQP